MIIGLFIRHIKAYKGVNFIPIGFEHNFVSYIGENGIGKSSILEALNSFFNNKKYIVNKEAISDSISGSNNPYIFPIFLVEKEKITRNKKDFEKISEFFWNIEKKNVTPGIQGSMKEFFELREKIFDKKESHYLLAIGETNFQAGHKIYFGGFHSEENFLIDFLEKEKKEIEGKKGEEREKIIIVWTDELNKKLDTAEWKKILQELKSLYAYVYLPVELEVESFTKIETDEMQKIFDINLINEINDALKSVQFSGNTGINTKLDLFVDEIEITLNNEYKYDTGAQRGNTVTQTDIVEKIIESYFQKRILYKGKKKVSELSAGEKRQALIDLVYAFLIKSQNREKKVIIAIDEPENSLHTSLCYDQFEKLQKIAENNQILITTHWYGFLPIINEGIGHFLNVSGDANINFESYNLYDYKARIKSDMSNSKNAIPHDFLVKSTYDLVQSIFYSLSKEEPYNWLIVEGISEKIYFEYFFHNEIKNKKLRILCLGGQSKVTELYKYLELPVKNEKNILKGKIYCLIDTDQIGHEQHISGGYTNLIIRRLSNKNTNEKTELLQLDNADNSVCDIEQSLHPIIFKETIEKLDLDTKYRINTIVKENGNTNFIENLRNLDIRDYFKEAEGSNKIIFAKQYIEIIKTKEDINIYIPEWINIIKEYFIGVKKSNKK
ncbi:ATP-binding protein [Aliarcobacter butzleri]|uniref:ATP-binding protein n=1 Tax=Aliarcobacter butzleri TaxID=28197 RepID=UPI0021B2234C|nr:ATP-binding protein [Aliarcobacter butzleri]MCT7536147.1 ATP-binding protein [Aliarcobacter butzleri]MCT7622845.1 ATP-binding protein [Aliarcobacter butzleri]